MSVVAWVITRKDVDSVQEHARDGTVLPDPIVRPMAFVTLEDESGLLETTWFADSYRACGAVVEEGKPFWVQGKVAVDSGVVSLEVTSAWSIHRRKHTSTPLASPKALIPV